MHPNVELSFFHAQNDYGRLGNITQDFNDFLAILKILSLYVE